MTLTPGKLILAATPTWNPTFIETALWLDAADASTITESGGSVSQWDDKSGNGRNAAQSTPANRPTLTASNLNNLDVITFDGSDDVLIATLNTGLSSSFAFFTVVVPLRTNAIESYVTSQVSSYNNYWANLGLGGVSGGTKATFSLFNGVNNPIASYITPSIGLPYLYAGARDTNLGNIQLFSNGTQVSVASDTTTSVPVYSDLQIGGQTAPSGRYANARIAEVIIVSSSPTTIVRQKIEGYLAHKWGLTANLPADHPYKTVEPTP
jgi:hypothetical protein